MMELCNGRVETTWPEILHNPLACNVNMTGGCAPAQFTRAQRLKVAGDWTGARGEGRGGDAITRLRT